MEVRVDVAVGELDEREARVGRAGVPADEHAPRQPALCSGSAGDELDLLATDQGVHAAHDLREVALGGEVGAADVGAAGDEQLVGREAGDDLAGRSGVTITSSSMRAAERPSLAAQYVSSANTIPTSSSIGSSNECSREIIGAS